MSDFDRRLASEVEAASPQHPPPYADVLALRARRRVRRRASVAVAGAVVLVAGVLGGTAVIGGGEPRTGGPMASPSPAPETRDPASGTPEGAPAWDGEGVPPVVLRLDGREVDLEPWGYCYGNACVDGMAVPPFEDVGDRDEVAFAFPLAGWEFDATFTPLEGGRCARTVTVAAKPAGDHGFTVPAAGTPDAYRVDLFGRGPGGDVIVSFRWTTTEVGYLPEPTGYVGLLTDSGDGLAIYPLEMGLADLAETPRRATATVTVTDADGDSRSFGPVAAEPGCSGEGRVYFRDGESGAAQPTDLGPGPFTYRAEVTLDGTTYVGTAVWPRDERPEEAPYVDLVFDPPLPGYAG